MPLAPEDQLLLHAAQATITPERALTIGKLLGRCLDWSYVVDASVRHAVSPLLYRALDQVDRRGAGTAVPRPVLDDLGRLYDTSGRRNRRLYAVLAEVAAALAEEGVEAIGLKDILLARDVYPDVALRPMGDLDVLVRPSELDQAVACLGRLGFEPVRGPRAHFARKYSWGHHYRRASDNVWIDLQTDVMQLKWDHYRETRNLYDITLMWTRARPAAFAQGLLLPAPEDLLYHLCVHLEGHTYGELVLFSDIVEFLRRVSVEWSTIIEMADRFDTRSSLYYVLRLTSALFDVSVPGGVLKALEPTYFKGALHQPLFGNLGDLHAALDDAGTAVGYDQPFVELLERDVREQVAFATRVYERIDQVIETFVSAGGILAVPDGAPPPKVLPDPSVSRFGELWLLILDEQLPLLRRAVTDLGLQREQATAGEAYQGAWSVVTSDPLLDGRSLNWRLRVLIDCDVEWPHGLRHPVVSRAAAAVHSIRHRLLARRSVKRDVDVVLRVVALPRAAGFAYQSVRSLDREHNVLFALCSLLELFRRDQRPLDSAEVRRVARRWSAIPVAEKGLSVLDSLAGGILVGLAAGSLVTVDPPRLFAWARYHPDSHHHPSLLKRPFYFILGLLMTEDLGARLGLGLRLFPIGRASAAELFNKLRLARRQAVSSQRSAAEFAYWTEP